MATHIDVVCISELLYSARTINDIIERNGNTSSANPCFIFLLSVNRRTFDVKAINFHTKFSDSGSDPNSEKSQARGESRADS